MPPSVSHQGNPDTRHRVSDATHLERSTCITFRQSSKTRVYLVYPNFIGPCQYTKFCIKLIDCFYKRVQTKGAGFTLYWFVVVFVSKNFVCWQWYWPLLFGVTLNFKWARSTCGDEKIVSKKVFVHSEIKISDFLNWQTLSTVGELYLFYCRLVGDRDLSGVVTYNCTHSTSIETPFWLRFLIPHTTFTTLFFKPSQL